MMCRRALNWVKRWYKARLHSLEPFVHQMSGGWLTSVMRLENEVLSYALKGL